MPHSPALSPVTSLFEAQDSSRWSLGASGAEARRIRLGRLRAGLLARESELLSALHADLGKAPREGTLTELHPVLAEIAHALRHLPGWMAPRRVGTPLSLLGTRSWIRPEPKGRVLIMAPWNYPALLTLAPLVSAVAAGNAVILKPSEKAPATEAFLGSLIADCFPPEEVAVVVGGPEVAQELLNLPFDHIFFTGSSRVGRLVMSAAARHLSSVTLELGGKSPALLTEGADLACAARRIAWGKWLNAGQTCVAPDYVLVPENLEVRFLEELERAVENLYGADPLGNPDYGRIIDGAAFQRLGVLLRSCTGQVAFGGGQDEASRKMAPTVLRGLGPEDPLLQEEIFGPLLPVLAYRTREEALGWMRRLGDPLASYLFTGGRKEAKAWIRDTRAGGTVLGHAVIHLGNPELPFGGRGSSGFGGCHGRHGFGTFSHERAVLASGWLDTVAWTFPPYGGRFQDLVFRFLRWTV
ncbi:MAG: aldehyde dehydrogenase family protein [Acidobacteria bacterium]|nr:aldehyde dehydrogenase family protein [Acidobacteriota bacterium]